MSAVVVELVVLAAAVGPPARCELRLSVVDVAAAAVVHAIVVPGLHLRPHLVGKSAPGSVVHFEPGVVESVHLSLAVELSDHWTQAVESFGHWDLEAEVVGPVELPLAVNAEAAAVAAGAVVLPDPGVAVIVVAAVVVDVGLLLQRLPLFDPTTEDFGLGPVAVAAVVD